MTTLQPSVTAILTDLRQRFPDTPFLALGQTVWWDEPMKAVLRRMLDSTGLGGEMVLGVHDTDYFAKATVRSSSGSPFILVPHNDGETKGLWSAAGEISRLFGSETVPTRHDFTAHGVPFDRLVRAQTGDRMEFVNSSTEAWGWRGLVSTESRDMIVHRVALRDVGDGIDEMLRYGFEGTIESIADECCRGEARHLADSLLEDVRRYRLGNPASTLTDLYQHLFPRLFSLLLGTSPKDTGVCRTSHLLRFNPGSASLPRFEAVDVFLKSETARIAREAYNQAVGGTEIYTLDRFGLGALPFDLVLPEHGRGTLRVTLRAIHVETRRPQRIPLERPIGSVQELAEVLTREYGDEVVLVGKAVALISMLAREFIFVFSEEGSGYLRLTRKMNDFMRAAGVELDLRPILRLKYHTWDAIEVGLANLTLPSHLSSALGTREIPAPQFAAEWRRAAAEQSDLLETVAGIRSPRELLRFLVGRAEGPWQALAAEYASRCEAVRLSMIKAGAVQAEVSAFYQRLANVKREIVLTEKSKGDHFRATDEWTAVELDARAEFDARLSALLLERRQVVAAISALKARRMDIERGGATGAARARMEEIQIQAEMARLGLVRNALLTTRGLSHAQHRPSAWWIPMVDRTGHWFKRIVETTELYTEPLLSESEQPLPRHH